MSREHGEFRPGADGWAYHDVGSLEGTFHDGERERVTHVAVTGPVTLLLGTAAAGPAVTATATGGAGRGPATVCQPDRDVLRIGRGAQQRRYRRLTGVRVPRPAARGRHHVVLTAVALLNAWWALRCRGPRRSWKRSHKGSR